MNRAVMAQRAAKRPVRTADLPMLRANHIPIRTGPIRRSTAVKMTATQRNSEGKSSEWNRSMDYFTDPKWGRTVSEVRHG